MATEMPIPQDYGRHIAPAEYSPGEGEDDPSIHELFSAEALENAEVEETQDGGAVVRMEENGPLDEPDFYENLAERIPQYKLGAIAMRYLDLIEKDKDARTERDKQYEEGIKRTGLGKDAPGGATFNGASKVVHPVLAEAGVDFAARAIKELFPPAGPVKSHIFGATDEDKQKKADNKRDFMNWQFTQQIEEARDEEEQMATQLPFGGSQYLKIWYDEELRRPRFEFIPIDNIYLPFAAVNFYTASRVTEVDDITQDTFEQRVDMGMYRDVTLTRVTMEPDMSATEKANLKIEGKKDDGMNPDGVRRTYNVYLWMTLDEEDDSFAQGRRAPYIMMLDDQSGEMLGLYRNWEFGDEKRTKLDHIIEFKFIPWRGAYAIGLPHLIGGLSAALTGSLRALLDSAHINNAATMLKLKGAKISGQSTQVEVTQVAEIEGAPGVDDIRKLAMPMPFNPPSPVLFQLLGFLTDAAKGVVTTSEEKIADVNANAPVGTTQALIEQGAVVFSAVHARLHNSQMRVMKVLSRINRWYLDEMDTGDILRQFPVSKDDFEKDDDVMPVSDPNIFSDTQRYAQAQAIGARAAANPDLYNRLAVEKRILTTMKVPNIGELLPDPQEVEDMNPALENVAMTLGKPVGAFPSQDDLAHIQVHLDYALNPVFGMNPLIAPTFLPALLEHMKQHFVMWYLKRMGAYSRADLFKVQQIEQKLQQVLAVAGQHVKMDSQQLGGVLQALQPVLQQIQQLKQAATQSPPTDPNAVALLQSSIAETQRKAAQDQQRNQLEQARLAQSAKEHEDDLALKAAMNTENNLVEERMKTMDLSAEQLRLRDEQVRSALEAQSQLQRTI